MKNVLEMFSMEGKTALITGATGYLGTAMAFALAEAGAHVRVNGRDHERVNALVDRLVESGATADAAVFDVTHEAEVAEYFDLLGERPLHVLINNAYVGGAGPIGSATPAAYRDSYEVTLVAAHSVLRSALRGLRQAVASSGDASVINLGSMYGMVSADQRLYETAAAINPPFYGAAKAALLHWSRYAACEFGPEGIRSNSISPGPFPSGQVRDSNPDFVQKLGAKVPLGRVGLVDEIKGPVLFLASAASSFVNGTNLVVDGGWTAW